MLTDKELLEIETLLIEKYSSYDFGEIKLDEVSNEIIVFREDFEDILILYYSDRYEIRGKDIIMSLDLFNLLKMRYFSSNTKFIIKKLPF